MDPIDIKEHIRRHRDQQDMQILEWHIKHAIQPFDPGIVELYLSDIGIIKITSSSYIDDVFVIDGAHEMFFYGDHDTNVARLGTEAGRFFRSRMDESVPDNIILGEY